MKFYIKKAAFPVIYLIMSALTAFAAVSFPNNLMALKIIIGLINIGVYVFVIAYYSFKNGEESLKVRNSNDIIRRRMLETGEVYPIKKAEEYKAYKGFMIGAITCIPLALLWVIYGITVAITKNPTNAISGITMLLYMAVIMFWNLDENNIVSSSAFFYTGIYFPFVIILTGVFYILGAKKAEKLYDSIEKKNQELYGEKK